MISHDFSSRIANRPSIWGGSEIPGIRVNAAVRSAWSAGYGPLRVEHDAAARLQGARLDSRIFPLSSRPRRLRRPVLLSGARSPRDRRWRKCPDGGDRGADRTFCPVLRRARAVRPGALRHQRDAQDRRRGADDVERRFEASCGYHRGGDLRRPRSQVSDLGAGPVPERARGGHRQGARAQGPAWFPVGGAQRARSTGMTAGGDGFAAVAGGPALHIPVLGRPALDFLKVHDGGTYIDATFGAGGYSAAILAAANCKVIGIDRDPSALAIGQPLVEAASGRLTLVEDRFSNLDAVARGAGVEAVDGVVLDLGVSSMQLDTAERGFSFRLDGPLDMRMGGDGPSAADVVNAAGERDLANIIFLLGEERHSRAVARAIVKARSAAPIRTTATLAEIVASVVRSRPGDIHPATRTFQALRIFVNDELGELVAGLQAAERILKA